MRIANSTIIYNFLASLNKSQQRMNTIQEAPHPASLVLTYRPQGGMYVSPPGGRRL